MRIVLNIIWFVLAGLPLWLTYVFFGLFSCIFIITIPAGIACLRLANFVVWPFGRQAVDNPAAGSMSTLGNIIWFLVAGLWLAIGHLTTAFFLAITIIGIPFAWQNIKFIPVTCFPFGKQIVRV